jgi:hypothetical protein
MTDYSETIISETTVIGLTDTRNDSLPAINSQPETEQVAVGDESQIGDVEPFISDDERSPVLNG